MFVKFENSNNFKQKIDERDFKTTKNLWENTYQPMDFKKNLKKKVRKPKVWRLLTKFCDFHIL